MSEKRLVWICNCRKSRRFIPGGMGSYRIVPTTKDKTCWFCGYYARMVEVTREEYEAVKKGVNIKVNYHLVYSWERGVVHFERKNKEFLEKALADLERKSQRNKKRRVLVCTVFRKAESGQGERGQSASTS